jgi:HPt (histidine-containing phosphotransfer) domain-containing protein
VSEKTIETNVTKSSDPLGKIVPISGQYATVATSAIDTEHLDYLHSIGGESFVIDMVDGFLEDVAECIATMRAAVRDGDAHQFRFSAHAFKSSSNNIGAKALADICAALEKTTEAEFAHDGQLFLSKVEAELAGAITDLENLAPQIRRSSAF